MQDFTEEVTPPAVVGILLLVALAFLYVTGEFWGPIVTFIEALVAWGVVVYISVTHYRDFRERERHRREEAAYEDPPPQPPRAA